MAYQAKRARWLIDWWSPISMLMFRNSIFSCRQAAANWKRTIEIVCQRDYSGYWESVIFTQRSTGHRRWSQHSVTACYRRCVVALSYGIQQHWRLAGWMNEWLGHSLFMFHLINIIKCWWWFEMKHFTLVWSEDQCSHTLHCSDDGIKSHCIIVIGRNANRT